MKGYVFGFVVVFALIAIFFGPTLDAQWRADGLQNGTEVKIKAGAEGWQCPGGENADEIDPVTGRSYCRHQLVVESFDHETTAFITANDSGTKNVGLYVRICNPESNICSWTESGNIK